jgi:hypothetical protein
MDDTPQGRRCVFGYQIGIVKLTFCCMPSLLLDNQSKLQPRFVFTLTLFLMFAGCAKKQQSALPAEQKAGKEMDRYAWLLATSAGDYLKVGTRDSKWDALVLQSLTNQSRAKMDFDKANWWDGILKASDAGCNDPLVGYWRVRAKYGEAANANAANLTSWTNAASALEQSSYSPYRKFYASLCAFEAMRATRHSTQPATTDRTNWMMAFSFYINSARINAARVAGNSQAPAEEVLLLIEDFLGATEWASESRQRFIDAVEPALLRGHPSTSQTEHLLGHFELVRAWLARGNDHAANTSEKQFREFQVHLEQAEKLLLKAWKTQPRVETAIQMMRIQLGRSDSRNEMEQWFQQGMALQTNSYATARAKYYYLEPKWHGSREQQHQFAQACVASTNWGGNVPRIMLDFFADIEPADDSSKKSFYARSDIWADIQSALDKLLKLNPDESGWHHHYFKFACLAEDWEVAARELQAMGEVLDYSFFGGEQRFREMAANVQSKVPAAKRN